MYVILIKSIYGRDGLIGDHVTIVKGRSCLFKEGGDIVRDDRHMDILDIDFSSYFTRNLGEGSGVTFWNDRWVGEEGRKWVGIGDTWKWKLDDEDIFPVKALSSLVEAKSLNISGDNVETVWNKLIPNKISFLLGGRYGAGYL
ncbi:hypothetical protein Tco_0206596 [Tanacetum coccineum]